MASRFLGSVRLSPRARHFYRTTFEPAYKSLQNATEHTPLVIMLWGPPRLWTREQARQRKQIHDVLEQLGHTIISDEHLGTAGSTLKKGVEFLPSNKVDLIVAIQPLYRIIGSVRHFVEMRVVESKMFLLVDQIAADGQLYAPALADLTEKYDNVETYDSSQDSAKSMLLNKIINKVHALQIVKYRALQQSQSWGLEKVSLNLRDSRATAHPFPYNLLELYREHRNEIDVLIFPISLFILAFTYHIGKITLMGLTRDLELPQSQLGEALDWLKSAGFLTQAGAEFQISDTALRLLHSVGLTAPTPKVSIVMPRAITRQRELALSGIAGIVLAGVILASLAILNGASVWQNNQPLEFTPVPTSSITIKTAVPSQVVTPTLTLDMPPSLPAH